MALFLKTEFNFFEKTPMDFFCFCLFVFDGRTGGGAAAAAAVAAAAGPPASSSRPPSERRRSELEDGDRGAGETMNGLTVCLFVFFCFSVHM